VDDLTARLQVNQLEIRRVQGELADVNARRKALAAELGPLLKLRDSLLAELAEPTPLPLFEEGPRRDSTAEARPGGAALVSREPAAGDAVARPGRDGGDCEPGTGSAERGGDGRRDAGDRPKGQPSAPAGQPVGTVGHPLGALSSTAGVDQLDRPLSEADTELVTGSVPKQDVHQAVCVELLGHKPADADGLLVFAVWEKLAKKPKHPRPPLYYVKARTWDDARAYVVSEHPAGTKTIVKVWEQEVPEGAWVRTVAPKPEPEPVINRDLEAVLEAESDADAEEQALAATADWRSVRLDSIADVPPEAIKAFREGDVVTLGHWVSDRKEDHAGRDWEPYFKLPIQIELNTEDVINGYLEAILPRCRHCGSTELDPWYADGQEWRLVADGVCNVCEPLAKDGPTPLEAIEPKWPNWDSEADRIAKARLPKDPKARVAKLTKLLTQDRATLEGYAARYRALAARYAADLADDNHPAPELQRFAGIVASAKAPVALWQRLLAEAQAEADAAVKTKAEKGAKRLSKALDREANEQRKALEATPAEGESHVEAWERTNAAIREQRTPRGVRPNKTVKPKPAGVRP
jgi:hypothetical protein